MTQTLLQNAISTRGWTNCPSRSRLPVVDGRWYMNACRRFGVAFCQAQNPIVTWSRCCIPNNCSFHQPEGMLLRTFPRALGRPLSYKTSAMSSSSSQTPMEDALRAKLTAALHPTTLLIHNDSHLHAHHAAMAGNTSPETHFRYELHMGKRRWNSKLVRKTKGHLANTPVE